MIEIVCDTLILYNPPDHVYTFLCTLRCVSYISSVFATFNNINYTFCRTSWSTVGEQWPPLLSIRWFRMNWALPVRTALSEFMTEGCWELKPQVTTQSASHLSLIFFFSCYIGKFDWYGHVVLLCQHVHFTNEMFDS